MLDPFGSMAGSCRRAQLMELTANSRHAQRSGNQATARCAVTLDDSIESLIEFSNFPCSACILKRPISRPSKGGYLEIPSNPSTRILSGSKCAPTAGDKKENHQVLKRLGAVSETLTPRRVGIWSVTKRAEFFQCCIAGSLGDFRYPKIRILVSSALRIFWRWWLFR